MHIFDIFFMCPCNIKTHLVILMFVCAARHIGSDASRVVGQRMHVLINDLNMDDGRAMLEPHFFGEQTINGLIRAHETTRRRMLQVVGLRRARVCGGLCHLLLLLLSRIQELQCVYVDDARVCAHPQRVGLLL